MKEHYIEQLKAGQELDNAYFMAKSFKTGVDKNGKKYIDLTLGDKTGEINGKKWNATDEECTKLELKLKEGVTAVIRINASVNLFNNNKQLKISKINLTGAEDNLDMSDFVPAAPERAEDMYDYIYSKASNFYDAELKKLCVYQLEKHKEKLMYYPAASRNHHAERAGLLWHSKRMLMMAEAVCDIYTNLNRELLMAGTILHDIEKMIEIDANEMGVATGYSFEGKLLGHLVMGVREIERICIELGINREKTVMIEHMILSHHQEPEWGSPIRPMFPEAEMLHYLDMIDAKMYDMEEAVNSAEPGDFSERIWTLNNRQIYRAKGE